MDLKNNLFDDALMSEIMIQNRVDFQNLEHIIHVALSQHGWLSKIETTIQALAKNTIQDFNR